MSDQNNMSDVGQTGTYKDVVDKYDAEHGKYKDNVPQPPPIPTTPMAGPDPSPFKLGPT